jgi:hypothetical protein
VSRRFRPTDAYADESIRGRRYVMGCVLVEARHLGPLRRSIEGLASGVAPRVHFNNDSDRQKRRVLDAIAEMPIEAFAVMCTKSHSTNEFQARAACVAEIVRQVQRREVANLVLESRQDDRDDERVISRTRTRADARLRTPHCSSRVHAVDRRCRHVGGRRRLAVEGPARRLAHRRDRTRALTAQNPVPLPFR